MFRLSLNQVLSSADLQFFAVSLTIVTMIVAWLTIVFEVFILSTVICSRHLGKSTSNNASRRIGLLHSMNSYLHLLGNTLIFLFISLRTLFSESYSSSSNKPTKFPMSLWHCRLLNYLTCIFTAGIFGSCFCQSLFRFWRLTKPRQSVFRKFSFHLSLMIGHWLLILVLSGPLWFRSVSVSSENFCVNQIHVLWPVIYVCITSLVIPVFSIIIVYIKIILFIQSQSHVSQKLSRVKRDVFVIRRIVLLVCVLLSTSSLAIALWLLASIHPNLHPLAYRLFSLVSVMGMLTYSITFVVAFPQLRRTIRDGKRSSSKQSSQNKMADFFRRGTHDELTLLDKEFHF